MWFRSTAPHHKSLDIPLKGPADARPLNDVFRNPHVGLTSPDDVVFKDRRIPTQPGAPATTGLQQVVYDDQPMYDRYAPCTVGPVVTFFRNLIGSQGMTRQP